MDCTTPSPRAGAARPKSVSNRPCAGNSKGTGLWRITYELACYPAAYWAPHGARGTWGAQALFAGTPHGRRLALSLPLLTPADARSVATPARWPHGPRPLARPPSTTPGHAPRDAAESGRRSSGPAPNAPA